MEIRKSKESERIDILKIHKKAFGQDKGVVIADLVDNLLDDETAIPILSLVATDDEPQHWRE